MYITDEHRILNEGMFKKYFLLMCRKCKIICYIVLNAKHMKNVEVDVYNKIDIKGRKKTIRLKLRLP